MPHKADPSFFDKKRPWSRTKDEILNYYLPPYIAKVATVGKPIVLVDGFAGRGRYRDGETGSPVILCEHAKTARQRGTDVSVLCIEQDNELYNDLRTFLRDYAFASVRCGEFGQFIDDISALARTSTIFLYLDPYTVSGINWSSLDHIFEALQRTRSSVELLLNFSSNSFVRRGLAAFKITGIPGLSSEIGDDDEPTPIDDLNEIVGGTWWQSLLLGDTNFGSQVYKIAESVLQNLNNRFAETGMFPVRDGQDEIPKYYLMFASRHPDGLRLMNEAMCNAVNNLGISMDLFAESDLSSIILEVCSEPLERGNAMTNVMRREIGRFSEKRIRNQVRQLLEVGLLTSETGKSRINDKTKIWWSGQRQL